MRFTLLSLLFLTMVTGIAFATVRAAVDPALGATVNEILHFSVVLLAAAALTTGMLSFGRLRVFSLTWGIFVITQILCHSCPSIATSWIENVVTVPAASTGPFSDAVPYVHIVGAIWFNVGVATMSGFMAVLISGHYRSDRASPE